MEERLDLAEKDFNEKLDRYYEDKYKEYKICENCNFSSPLYKNRKLSIKDLTGSNLEISDYIICNCNDSIKTIFPKHETCKYWE